MATVYLGLGTNMGDKHKNIATAVKLLTERVGEFLALSDLYETEPWGFESDNTFLNAVLVLKTELDAFDLLDTSREVEVEMGRKEKSNGTYKDRIIDIDLLLLDNQIVNTDRLTLPHPLMHQRTFVMKPMAQVAPDLIHPVSGKTMREILSEL